ncbi:hypothetical protein CC80DRAFT_496889 [Byssothecium circinans]|uniref:Uncharacterized protein n=1 Tax=Byssothecium circinans TaxID=147558 RepID=A0A6A5TD63_9PLEO|nr:hypothetical protein CC80DRAFT_496889 [Byssothecium circinans]
MEGKDGVARWVWKFDGLGWIGLVHRWGGVVWCGACGLVFLHPHRRSLGMPVHGLMFSAFTSHGEA